ncbi:MAG: hypothetical protein R2710_30480 [Acidimicrobiales bacterium]
MKSPRSKQIEAVLHERPSPIVPFGMVGRVATVRATEIHRVGIGTAPVRRGVAIGGCVVGGSVMLVGLFPPVSPPAMRRP